MNWTRLVRLYVFDSQKNNSQDSSVCDLDYVSDGVKIELAHKIKLFENQTKLITLCVYESLKKKKNRFNRVICL